jgi:hypothetical protein
MWQFVSAQARPANGSLRDVGLIAVLAPMPSVRIQDEESLVEAHCGGEAFAQLGHQVDGTEIVQLTPGMALREWKNRFRDWDCRRIECAEAVCIR